MISGHDVRLQSQVGEFYPRIVGVHLTNSMN